MTSLVSETVANMVSGGQFGFDEAIRCYHDCLSVLSTRSGAASLPVITLNEGHDVIMGGIIM